MASDTDVAMRRRKVISLLAAVVLFGALGFFLFTGNADDPVVTYQREQVESVSTLSELSRQPIAERDQVEVFAERLDSLEASLGVTTNQVTELERENRRLRTELANASAETESVMVEAATMLESMAEQMARQSEFQQTRDAGTSPSTSRGPGGSVPSGRPSSLADGADPFRPVGVVESAQRSESSVSRISVGDTQISGRILQSVRFDTAQGDGSTDVAEAVIRDPQRYVPPNSYAPARVLVGVDAATGTSFGSDPKPVMFRITGAAVSVLQDGDYVETDLEGCLVNGAAYAELSSEKVYVRLQRMTCPLNDGSGRVSEAEVEGYIAHAGKAGVRGRVISREGDLTERAMIAGTLQGLGQSFSRVGTATGAIGNVAAVTGGQGPTSEEIAISSIGGGIEGAASTLSQYYIERAEQYQPVVEMPTGIDVEIVFLSGVVVR
jgi:conjugal transfer pilus assembly protein TraB|tara:strand:+ start:9282 stop:10595 length:1314 start_codon:yes stop_codon:yes gene_type:complete